MPTFMLREDFVAGSRDQASGSASSYVDVLRADRLLGREFFDPITLETLNPDARQRLSCI